MISIGPIELSTLYRVYTNIEVFIVNTEFTALGHKDKESHTISFDIRMMDVSKYKLRKLRKLEVIGRGK